jgi:hypothetical protein
MEVYQPVSIGTEDTVILSAGLSTHVSRFPEAVKHIII